MFNLKSRNKEIIHFAFRKIDFHNSGIANTTALTIEHLAPQNPSDESNEYWNSMVGNCSSGIDQDYSDWVHNWGNLSLLEIEIQLEVLNHDWKRKTSDTGLINSTFKLTNELATLPDWTEELIVSRGKWIFERIKELTGLKFLTTNSEIVKKTFF